MADSELAGGVGGVTRLGTTRRRAARTSGSMMISAHDTNAVPRRPGTPVAAGCARSVSRQYGARDHDRGKDLPLRYGARVGTPLGEHELAVAAVSNLAKTAPTQNA